MMLDLPATEGPNFEARLCLTPTLWISSCENSMVKFIIKKLLVVVKLFLCYLATIDLLKLVRRKPNFF